MSEEEFADYLKRRYGKSMKYDEWEEIQKLHLKRNKQ